MSTMNTCKVLKDAAGNPTGVIVLPKGRMLYPALFKAQAPKGETEDKAKFGLTILLPKDADLSALIGQIDGVIAENVPLSIRKTTKVRKPFIKVNTDEQPKVVARLEAAGIDPAEFPIMLRCLTKQRPSVVAADLSVIEDDTETYDGRWCRVSVRPYFYDHATGGKGVSVGMNNVQLFDHDEVIPRVGGSNANDEFEAVGTSDPFS